MEQQGQAFEELHLPASSLEPTLPEGSRGFGYLRGE